WSSVSTRFGFVQSRGTRSVTRSPGSVYDTISGRSAAGAVAPDVATVRACFLHANVADAKASESKSVVRDSTIGTVNSHTNSVILVPGSLDPQSSTNSNAGASAFS